LKISDRNAGAGVAENAARGGVLDAAGRIGSVDPIQNEAMHDKTDCKNDAGD
jgi:hypothetical protein